MDKISSSNQQSINTNVICDYQQSQQQQHHLLPGQQHSQRQLSSSQQPQIMFQQFSQLVNQTKGVITRMKQFFQKYLPNQENDFYNRDAQPHLVESYQKHQNEQYNKRQNQNLYELEENREKVQQQFKLEEGKMESCMNYNRSHMQKQEMAYGNVYHNNNSSKQRQQAISMVMDNNTNQPPKPPLMPYFIFLQQNRKLIKQKHPQMSLAQIGSLAGKIWKCLSEQERQQYKNRYQKQRRIYEQKMLRYHHQVRIENARKKKQSKKQSYDQVKYYGGSYNE